MQYFFGCQRNINSETWAKIRVDIKYKGNDHLQQATKTHRRVGVQLSSLTSVTDKVDGQCHAPASVPRGKGPGTHYTGGWVATGPVCAGAEILDLPGFDPPTFRPAVSCYADWTIPIPIVHRLPYRSTNAPYSYEYIVCHTVLLTLRTRTSSAILFY